MGQSNRLACSTSSFRRLPFEPWHHATVSTVAVCVFFPIEHAAASAGEILATWTLNDEAIREEVVTHIQAARGLQFVNW
jgi:hypothetical protein